MTKPSDYLTADIIKSVLQESDSEDEFQDEGFESPFNSENSESDDDTSNDAEYYLSKNGSIKWLKKSSVPDISQNSEPERKNSGVQFFAQHATTPFDAFLLFFDNEVIDLILNYSNIHVRKHGERYGDTKEINKNEIHAVIGLLLYWGIMKSPQSNDTVSTAGPVDIYRMAMCKSRFRFIIKCLKFDNIEERKSNKLDYFSQISELLKLVGNNFKKVYVPNSSVTIFKHVIPYNGRFPFKYYSHTERKSGVKITNLVDSKTFYYLSLEIHCNKTDSRSASMSAALNLIDSVKVNCRDVITDEAHTSVALSIALKQLGLNNKGKLTKNDKDVPKIFKNIQNSDSSLYGYSDHLMLMSYKHHQEDVQIYLSNNNQDIQSDKVIKEHEFIKEINKSQQNIEEYLLNFGGGRSIKRWPILIFAHLISAAQMNAQIVYNENTRTNTITTSEFVKQLSLSLIRRHMESRSFVSQIFRLYIPDDFKDKTETKVNEPKQVPSKRS